MTSSYEELISEAREICSGLDEQGCHFNQLIGKLGGTMVNNAECSMLALAARYDKDQPLDCGVAQIGIVGLHEDRPPAEVAWELLNELADPLESPEDPDMSHRGEPTD